MFNMNPVEMIIIGVIALVVVGPRGLPEIGRMVGKWMRTFREAADEMKRGLNFEEDYRPTSTYKRLPPPHPRPTHQPQPLNRSPSPLKIRSLPKPPPRIKSPNLRVFLVLPFPLLHSKPTTDEI
ncbi:MAG: twin-arginine translocase TatA/TatE family subunit [Candidatus Omnitrophica bacterium]|nr:twin-arginine translocase TatA/TatE family subunit [Candidatus Omnitrophota bacterium]